MLAMGVLAISTGRSFAQDLLNATCTPGAKLLVTDYKNYPTNTIGRGHDMAAFVRGKNAAGVDQNYMMLVWSMDSGKGDGGLSFWSWDQPATWSAPSLKKHLPASQLREAHSTPVTNMVANDWRTWVLQATPGFSVYDLDSIASPKLVTTYGITGPSNGGAGSAAICAGTCAGSFDAATYDYDNGAVWFTALAAPYLYVAQAGNGLNIYRFTDPANPASISWVKRYDTSWFGHRVNQFWVRGNVGFASAVQDNYGVTVVDLSDPVNLVKIRQYGITSSPPIRNSYAWTLNGNRLYAATKAQGGTLPAGLAYYDIDPLTLALTQKKETAGQCSSGGYAAIQDGYAHVGLSICYQKIRISDFAKLAPTSPPYWAIGIQGADNDFVTPLGNTVFVGNDHHTTPGSMVLCHQAAKDTTRPTVNGRNPRSGVTGVKTTGGVGLSFTDNLKPWTISPATLPIRVKSTGALVPGYYSYQLNTVNFRPATPFAKGTVYEVVVTSGVKDLAGNGATASTATFTTGN
jgi:hypothetical protein